ncbi:preprotein translocase subunit SecE [Demequina aurantiaca]|uniref:preprotein translocase subunit SecE n=1 Tax=Demequina aurantiaca TaxID=676200 RepID=UPI003D34806C
MSESAMTEAGEDDPRHQKSEGRFIIGPIVLFVRQVLAELRRVVTPTREELIRYIWVVVGFVAVMMVLVFIFDVAFGWMSQSIFGG